MEHDDRGKPAPRVHSGRPHHFFGTSRPSNGNPFIWEIHREGLRGADLFEIYLDGRCIGKERGAAELAQLLVGVKLACDDAKGVLAALKANRVIYVEVEPGDLAECRKPAPESRFSSD